MDIKELFPTPIWLHDFKDATELDIVRQAASWISKAALANKAPDRSNEGFSDHTGVDFDGPIHNHKISQLLIPALKKASEQYGYDVNEAKLYYWGIVSHKYSYNKRHHHPGGLLSGVMYLDVSEGAGNLVLNDPRYGKLMEIQTCRSDHTRHLQTVVHAQIGRLVIFPSWLEHEVEFTTSDKPRIILSFNFSPIK